MGILDKIKVNYPEEKSFGVSEKEENQLLCLERVRQNLFSASEELKFWSLKWTRWDPVSPLEFYLLGEFVYNNMITYTFVTKYY